MNAAEALELIRPAVPAAARSWVDMGAGHGTFTEALAHIVGSDGRLIALDRDDAAIRALHKRADSAELEPELRVVRGDFTDVRVLQRLELDSVDGVLFANALHFVPDPAPLLRAVAAHLKPGARIVIVEYDRTSANRWVPYPISSARLERIASESGLPSPEMTGRRSSAYGRDMYCAWMEPVPAKRRATPHAHQVKS